MKKMNNTFKRIISSLMALVLVAGMIAICEPLSVSAAEAGGDIIVTYAGNVYQAPGDVVMLRGSKLTSTVDVNNILLARVDDTGYGEYGFIDRTAYDYDGVHDGEFTQDPSTPNVNWDNAVKLDMVYVNPNGESVQFIIPETDANGDPMEHGIYALKLTGPTDEKIVYLNAPVIDYVLGSDGSFASPGTLLEVVGENIAPNQNSNEDAVAAYKRYKDRDPEDLRAVLVSKADPSVTYDLKIADITSDYNIVVEIPSTIPVADNGETSKWELYVYNGYGDNTCWSIPAVVEIGKAWADRIPDNFINIQEDYGLTGNYKENATPVLQSALNALAELGGGTLYLPEGTYRLEYTLYVPDNVHIKGESVGLTNILPVYFNDNYNNLPNSTILLSGDNIEISDVSFYLKRCRAVINTYGSDPGENIRLNNLKFYTNVGGWANNSEGSGAPLAGRFELFNYNESIRDDASAFIAGVYKNLRVTNINANLNENRIALINCYNSECNYGYFANIEAGSNPWCWNRAIFNNSVWKDSTIAGGTATQGYGVYHYNVKFGPCSNYNREITVADLDGNNGYYYEIHTEDGLAAEDSVYLEIYNSEGVRQSAAGNSWLVKQNYQIYIQGNSETENYVNGVGQTRMIVGVDEERNCLIINRPFADTSFNKTNFTNTREPREDIYWVDCEFYEGQCGGSFYGGCADVVLDGTHREYNYNCYQSVKNGDCNWYMTIMNECWENTPYSLIASFAVGTSGTSYSFKCHTRLYAQIGIVLRNNDVTNMRMMNDSWNHMQYDFILDNNRFNDMEYVIWFDKLYAPVGLTLYRNSGNELQEWFAAPGTLWDAGNRVTVLDDEFGKVESTMLGDVNGDGRIDLDDAEYLEEALAGKFTLLAANRANADVDGDKELTAMDVLYIRFYADGTITQFPVETFDDSQSPTLPDDDTDDSEFTPGYH